MDSIDIIIEVVKRLTGQKEKASNVTINKIIVKDLEKNSPHTAPSEFEDPKTIKAERFI